MGQLHRRYQELRKTLINFLWIVKSTHFELKVKVKLKKKNPNLAKPACYNVVAIEMSKIMDTQLASQKFCNL